MRIKLNRILPKSVLIAALSLHATAALAATPASWKETGFSINASGMSLGRVLAEFGSTYGVRISSTLPGNARLKGRMQAPSGAEFLDRLALAHGFRWFVYNDTLYVAPLSDVTSARVEVGEDAVADAKAALIGLGLFDQRFGWGEMPDEGVVIVSGPQQYVRLVRATLLPEGKKPDPDPRQLMIFRLKYASATDRVVTTRGQSDTIPGVKTILSNLINAGFQSGPGADLSDRLRGRASGLGNNPRELITNRSAPQAYGDDARTSGSSSPRTTKNEESGYGPKRKASSRNQPVRIEADPSLNAILIYDDYSRRAMYQAFIAELDVEPQQVEIEALIVDIDRSKLAQLGAEWGFSIGNVATTINGTAAPSSGVDLPIPGSTLLIRNSTSFYMRLNALQGRGEAEVLAKPTVLTLDNVAAVLDLNQSAYVPLVGERVASLADITAGTMLKVVPRVVQEGSRVRVRLDVDIEDGALAPQSGSSTTGVTRSTITTQAIIEPQQTLLIGGYHSTAKTQNRQKIPVLGDIPVVGPLFRNDAEQVSNRERLFLITPRLVASPGMPAPARSTVDEQARRLAATNEDFGAGPQPGAEPQPPSNDNP